ncbi:MAG: glycosyltransferase [Gammaproteobacteria bacterium]
MHVLMIPSWYPTRYNPISGKFFLEQAKAIQSTGARVGVIYPDLRGFGSIRFGKILNNRWNLEFVERASIPHLFWNGWNTPKLHWISGKLWRRKCHRLYDIYIEKYGRPDIIHAQSVLWAGVAASEISRKYGVPFVVTEHSSAYARGLIKDWQIPFIKQTFGAVERINCVSAELDRELQSLGCDPARIRIIPNSIDTDFWKKETITDKDENINIICVALLTRNKGIELLLHAFVVILNDTDNIHLTIIGDGPEYQHLMQLAERLDIPMHVSFLGLLQENEIKKNLERADAIVLASYHETFGVVLIEAMSMGIPVIATACGGPEDFVTPEVGYLVPRNDVPALRDALKAFISERDAWRRRTKEIREYAVANFSYQTVGTRLLAEYDEVLKETRAEQRK